MDKQMLQIVWLYEQLQTLQNKNTMQQSPRWLPQETTGFIMMERICTVSNFQTCKYEYYFI